MMVDLKAYEYLANLKRKRLHDRMFLISFIILALCHIADIISTVIGLSLGAYETNPIGAHLFTYGVIGYLINTVYILSVFYLLLLVIRIITSFYKKLTYEETPLALIACMYMILIVTMVIMFIFVIFNNISVIISLLLH